MAVIAFALVAVTARAGELDTVEFPTITAVTNTVAAQAAISTNDYISSAWLDSLYIDITTTYATPTATVVIASSGRAGVARTLWTGSVTADTSIAPRMSVVTAANAAIANESALFPIKGDKLTATVHTSNVTNTYTATIYVYIRRKP